MTRAIVGALAAAALAATPAARAQSLSVEAFGGGQDLRFASGSGGTTLDDQGTGLVGGDLLAGLGPVGAGLLVDRTVRGRGPWAGAFLGGLLVPLAIVRVELLGEVGRRGGGFSDLFGSQGETFAGFRPGVSVHLLGTPLLVGVSGMARWPVSNGGRDFGKPDYGLVARVGLALF